MPFFAASDGTKLFYQWTGNLESAYPLVLIHGGLVHSGSWAQQVEGLRVHFPLVTYDLRSYGLSDKPETGYEIPRFATDLIELLKHLGLEKVNLLGFSLGGFIAQYVSATSGHLVNKLILESTACQYTADGKEIMRQRASNLRKSGVREEAFVHIAKAFSEKYYHRHPEIIEQYRQEIMENNAESVAQTFESLAAWDGYEFLKRIEAPTLVLHGALDHAMPKSAVDMFQSSIKNVRMIEFPDIPDTPFITNNPIH